MRPCDKCLENNWKFEQLEDNFVRATCQMCSHEVEWQAKIEKETRTVCDCGALLIEKPTKSKPSQLNKPYYFTAYLFCTACRKMYIDNRFRVINNYELATKN